MGDEFLAVPAVRSAVPLLIGISGFSESGKSYSALRLAVGIQRIVKSDICFIDTEHSRGKYYAWDPVKKTGFKFHHVDFKPPFSPERFMKAIEVNYNAGFRIFVIDVFSAEHSAEGGVLDMVEQYLDKKCGDDEKARERNRMLAYKEPKRQRKLLENKIVQLGINAVFNYRAEEKNKITPGKGIDNIGYQQDTTSKLFWEMTQRFLLKPGAQGKPTLSTDKPQERKLIKNIEPFKDLVDEDIQLNEDLGEFMASWAAGTVEKLEDHKPQPKKEPEQIKKQNEQPQEGPKNDRDIALEVLKFYDKEKLIHSDFFEQTDKSIAWLINNKNAHEKNGFGKIRSLIFQIEERMEESMRKEHNLYQKDLF